MDKIKWNRYVTRPANEQDVAETVEWRKRHPGGAGAPYVLGEEIDVEEEVELPTKYAVCTRCEGKGSHVNPSIDGHGISGEEWNGPDWDDESREMYMTGGYDVACYECKGLRVVTVVDESKCDPKLYEDYFTYLEEKAAEDYADRRMRWAEDGGYGSMDDY